MNYNLTWQNYSPIKHGALESWKDKAVTNGVNAFYKELYKDIVSGLQSGTVQLNEYAMKVAYDGEIPVAVVFAKLLPRTEVSLSKKTHIKISSILVNPNERQQGYAQLAYEDIFRGKEVFGFRPRGVCAEVSCNNQPSIKLHQKLFFPVAEVSTKYTTAFSTIPVPKNNQPTV